MYLLVEAVFGICHKEMLMTAGWFAEGLCYGQRKGGFESTMGLFA